MELNLYAQHPYIQLLNTVKEQDVMVIDNVTGLPVYGEAYAAPDMLIILCHEGTVTVNDVYDSMFKAHEIAILLPDQIAISRQVSADYRATLIAISRKFHDHLQHTYPYTRYAPRYRRRPVTRLTEEQYQCLLNAVEVLRSITQTKSAHRAEMLSNLLSIMLLMIGESHANNQYGNSFSLSPNEQLFNRFYEAIIQHHRESHEMAFYARICCLSPKHFSEIIKRDTGITPKEWITNFLAARSKVLLDSREDHTIQQISNLLGFGAQSSFTRFFKKEIGMTPKEYRNQRILSQQR
jgi:AraC-like DNA-binding protein